ncbi:DUF99 family protein [Candidatus Woesearchaeota archaeon]|nr:DUF99 family protein [Candidatus Woesearchaeota archaeon]
MFKKEIRVLGIDDGHFDKFKGGQALVVGALFRGGRVLDGILSTTITVDGEDGTHKLILLANKNKFKPQIRCIFLDGITMGGFNLIDIRRLNAATGIPAIAIMRKFPDVSKIKSVLEAIGQQEKVKLIDGAGPIICINKIFAQLAGITPEKAKAVLDVCCTRSNIPEALRAAHLIASGVVLGESRGKA